MRAGSRLTLLAAGLTAAIVLALPAGAGARAEEGAGAPTPTPTDQQTLPPSTGGCPYRGGKLELIA
jgi:hypothetical protein